MAYKLEQRGFKVKIWDGKLPSGAFAFFNLIGHCPFPDLCRRFESQAHSNPVCMMIGSWFGGMAMAAAFSLVRVSIDGYASSQIDSLASALQIAANQIEATLKTIGPVRLTSLSS
jgi:hypothetical protein